MKLTLDGKQVRSSQFGDDSSLAELIRNLSILLKEKKR